MAQTQKPDFVFRRNGRVHLNRRGRQFSRLLAAELCASAVYTMFRGSVNGNVYPFHSPISPSFHLPCFTVCHHISTGLYHLQGAQNSRFTTNNKLLHGCTVCSSNAANIGFKHDIMSSLKMVHLCRNMKIQL